MIGVYTSGSQPAQYFGTSLPGMLYGPWGNIIQVNGQEYYVIINGVKYPVKPNPILPYSYVIPSFF